MPLRIRPVLPTVVGLLLLLVGFLYDVMFAGIPYQDPTAELEARYQAHQAVAGIFYRSGLLLMGLGLLVLPLLRRLLPGGKPVS